MNDFRKEYQSAIQDIREFHMDISDCMDERKHRKRVYKRARRVTTMAFSTICVVFVFGFGTVKAATYIQNEIMVDEWGFSGREAERGSQNEAQAYILNEELQSPAEEASLAAVPQAASENEQEASLEEAMENETEMTAPLKSYSSLEEFEKNEDIIFPQPSENIVGKNSGVEISVCGDWALVRYDMGGRTLWLERTDYENTSAHRSSKVFPEGVCNERAYTTGSGYTYTVVDSVRENDSDPLRIHAAVTVGAYEAFIDFDGYTELEAQAIMDSIDLSLYE